MQEAAGSKQIVFPFYIHKDPKYNIYIQSHTESFSLYDPRLPVVYSIRRGISVCRNVFSRGTTHRKHEQDPPARHDSGDDSASLQSSFVHTK
ncbi:hypothetical protein GDO78_012748 [Eleutherodactylus coqui]|uniref:Uncharacterized protein n=1 Tax=Eleutherodactylus coqui TaxID=57060 RepID=A0A8J6F0K4_ELECQ|nr:hypothetical protein GDO78_012748 [Eleutherodactylus coqui]